MSSIIDLPVIDGKYDLNALQNHFMHGGLISFSSLEKLITESCQILQSEPNLIELDDNCLVFGDFHGQYFDFLSEIFDKEWNPEHTKVFMGDYVDRGERSCEVLITLLCMKVNTPEFVILLRGNHESRSVSSRYGFKNECSWKYSNSMYDKFCSLFCYLPLAVVLTREIGKFLLCHGGISPSLRKLDDINAIDRFREPPKRGIFCDLLWSDPLTDEILLERPEFEQNWENIDYISNYQRGTSYIYGFHAIAEFINATDVRGIIRGHQCVDNGFEMHYFGDDESDSPYAFTVFSAATYSGNNKAAGMFISNEGINVRTYHSSDLSLKYSPTLLDGFKFSLEQIMKELNSVMDDFLDYVFSFEDSDLEEDSNPIDIAHLAQHLQEYEESRKETASNKSSSKIISVKKPEIVEEKSDKTIQKRAPFRSKRVVKNAVTKTKNVEQTPLAASVFTEQPTKYEKKKKIREEGVPLTIEELRERWLTMKEEHEKNI
ncbi:Serine/threonine-protein phosphatase [Entamoeba marina]